MFLLLILHLQKKLVLFETVYTFNLSEGIAKQSYNQVLDVLLQRSPSKVRDTQLLVVELRRITLLWDELWLGILNQHQADINKFVVNYLKYFI